MNDQQKGVLFLFKYRKLLAMAFVIGGLLGVGITFLIPPKFLSTAIVYPYNAHTRDEMISNPQFGFEFESEQLLQLLHSREMRQRTVHKFKLYDYYELDTTESDWESELSLKYIKDVTFSRSKYLSVVINVTFSDPKLAADVANFQVEEVNRYRTSIFESNRQAEFQSVKGEKEVSEKMVMDLRDSIYAIRSGDALLFNFIENLNNENYDPSVFVNDPKLEQLVIDYRFAYDRYMENRTKFEEMKRAISEPIPSVYQIDTAVPSYKKVSPSFTLNALIGAFVLLLLVFTIRYVLDKWAQLRSVNAQ